MATLESPLEALALEYASIGCFAVVNNVWTWIAVVTAAVGFWRIRVTTIKVEHGLGCGLLEGSKASKHEQESCHHEPQAMAGGAVEEAAMARAKGTEVLEPLVCDDGVTKGKLTMYYEVDDVDGERCVDRDGELTAVNYGGGLGSCGELWERWERVLKMRTGDDDWYRYVDLTVINGSVVRLWDDKRNS
ncbi:hypothetical protein Rs2_05463 [Raphanus sativus]|uniref:Uncharacterized protein LOC108840289 n=1 Tax=Raphanus sativus TaxID=3726 RepID=A0A6J0M7Z6_RAPSA|nr:uncharacterized protein LOC108840289 [Raphanus sativus]KAJ4910842.1 hypothetical protein Rs2_05463 [Raphanus sativus]